MMITENGTIEIPPQIQKVFGLYPNTEIDFIDKDGDLVLKKCNDVTFEEFKENLRKSIQNIPKPHMTGDELIELTRGDH